MSRADDYGDLAVRLSEKQQQAQYGAVGAGTLDGKAAGEPKVGCCCGRSSLCACMTAKQWLCCQMSCAALTVVLGGLVWIMLSPVLFSVSTGLVFVTSEDSFMYESWQMTWKEGSSLPPVPYYENFYLFNLLNVDDVLQGALPRVEELGPWIYRTNITKYNVEFLEDGTYVDYVYSKTYYFQPEMSALPEDTPVTILNPGYLGALYEADSESLIVIILAGPAAARIVDDIEEYYINPLVANKTFDVVLARCREIDPKCNTTSDMAIVQWGHYKLFEQGLYDELVENVRPDIFGSSAEFAAFRTAWRVAYPTSNHPIYIDAFKQALFGADGLVTDPAFYENFALAVVTNSTEDLLSKWGLTLPQAELLFRYTLFMQPTYSRALFDESIAAGSGLFTTRTAYEWLWTATDPLLKILFPSSPYINFIGNSTSPDDIYAARWRINTGKYDSNAVFNVTAYLNDTTAG